MAVRSTRQQCTTGSYWIGESTWERGLTLSYYMSVPTNDQNIVVGDHDDDNDQDDRDGNDASNVFAAKS